MTIIGQIANPTPQSGETEYIFHEAKFKASNDAVADQNERFMEADNLHNAKLLHLVKSDITDEQIESFQAVLESTMQVPYQYLGEKAVELYRKLESITADEDYLTEEVALASRLAPRRIDDIKEIQDTERERAIAKARKHVLKELEDIESAIAYTGQAWNIPTAIKPEDRAILHNLVRESFDETFEFEMLEEDIIPVTPEERTHQAEVAERAKHVVENREASNLITFYLAENVGRVVTVGELIRFLYVVGSGLDTERQYRSRVTSLLGPATNGKRIVKYLNDQFDLHLQYGWRILRIKDNTGIHDRVRHRIYRAVKPQDDTLEPRYTLRTAVAGQEVIDEFEPIISVETVPVQTDPIPVQPNEEHIESNESLPEEWAQKLEAEAEVIIENLKESYLFDEDTMRGTIIRSFSTSNKLGTETMRERMRQSGLMRAGEVKGDYMTREQRVIGLLYNTNRNILGKKGRRQNEALAIIRRVIARHLPKEQS